jgi:hypothetical protein
MEVEVASMAFNTNFLNARLHQDGKVTVSGRSTPPTVAAIAVTMAHGDKLWTETAADPQDALWQVVFTATAGTFAVQDRVHLTGVALRDDAKEPLVWQAIFELVDESAPPG